MERIGILLDLISGVLIAIDFISPSWGQSIGKWLLKQLPDQDEAANPLLRRTFCLNLALALFILFVLLLYAIFGATDSSTHLQWSNIVCEIILYLAGIVGGFLLVYIEYLVIYESYRGFLRLRKCDDGSCISESGTRSFVPNIFWIVSLLLGIFVLTLVRFASDTRAFLPPIIVSSCLAIWILPTVMLLTRLFVRWVGANPNEPSHALVCIGLLIFVINKAIHLMYLWGPLINK